MSNMINILVCTGILLGGIDEIRGNKKGYGAKFREAFEYIPSIAFSMVGMICLTNLIAFVLEKGIAPFMNMIHMDPAVLAGFLAVDMGGYQLAEKLAVNPAMGSYAGLMFGAIAHTLGMSEAWGITPLQKLLQRPFTWLGRKVGLDSVGMT